MATIYIIGDSTVDNNKPPFRGWGWAIQEYVREGITVSNHALSGRSSKSFLDQKLFEPVEKAMTQGDLLLIQFGHNDEKVDEARHTDPDSTFPENLKFICDAALAKGAQPVLVTPVCRRYFLGDGDLLYTHGEYPAAIRKLASENGIPLCDLKQMSRELFLRLGPELTEKLFVVLEKGRHPNFPDGHNDQTHFNAIGAAVMAKLVANCLRKMDCCEGFFL